MIERLLKSNKAVLVLSFFLALMLWSYVTQEAQRANLSEVTRTITNVPLAYRNLDETLELVTIPRQVDVTLRGPRERVYDLQPHDIQVFVDLKGLLEGTHRLSLQAQVPRGIRVETFNPLQVTVELEEVIMQFKPVTLLITGEPGGGLVVGDPILQPDQVAVWAPRSVLPEVVQVSAELNIAGATSETVQIVRLRAIDYLGREVTRAELNPDEVEARVPLVEPQKDVPVEVAFTGEPAAGYRVTSYRADPSVITIFGRKPLLQAVEKLQTEQVNLEGATENITTEVTLVIPEGIRLSRQTIQVEIVIEPQ